MVIDSEDHLQWPPYGEIGTRRSIIEKEMEMEDHFQQYHGGDGYDNSYDDIREKEVKEMEQAFDEAMWEWVLEQGPPQDDDIVWLKHRVVHETLAEAARQTPEFRADIMGFHADIAGVEYMTKFGKAWADSVHDTLVLGKLAAL